MIILEQRKRLLPTAVPSIFLFKKPSKERKTLRSGNNFKAKTTPINMQKSLAVYSKIPINDVPDVQCEIEIYQTSDTGNELNKLESEASDEEEMNPRPEQLQPDGLMSLDMFKEKPDFIKYYTGFKDYDSLIFLYNILGQSASNLNYKSKLGTKNEFFMTIMKLRQAKDDKELSLLFGVSESTVSIIITTWINFLYHQLKEINIWPSKKATDENMPVDFKDKFPNTRVILDATEIPIEKPSDVLLQSSSFSTYKNHNTLKTMIGCSPRGAVIFISESYGGSTSDRQIIERCDLVKNEDKFLPGDSIMADRGINIQDIFAARDVTVNIPHFLKGKSQLQPHEVNFDRKVASKRIHVERVIGLAKRFKILKKDLSSSKLLVGGEIVEICFRLINFMPSIVSEFA